MLAHLRRRMAMPAAVLDSHRSGFALEYSLTQRCGAGWRLITSASCLSQALLQALEIKSAPKDASAASRGRRHISGYTCAAAGALQGSKACQLQQH